MTSACLLGLGLAGPGGARAQDAAGAEASEALPRPRLYMLNFNREGQLTNPLEVELAVSAFSSNRRLKRVIIVSYGWANDQDSSYATYRQFIDDILGAGEEIVAMTEELGGHTRGGAGEGEVAVIGIGWDSSLTGFRKLFNDVLPFPMVADTLAWLPDQLMFPVSFWSKSSMADRIAYGGLRTTLNSVFERAFPDPDKRPEIYLLGHSFGTRVVSGLMKQRAGFVRVGTEAFSAADRVRGAVLLQPALNLLNLHRGAEYPVLVTQSRHDHALGGLFPVANLTLNSYGFTMFEAFFRHRVFGYLEETIGSTAGRVTRAAGIGDQEPAEPPEAPATRAKRSLPGRALYRTRRTLAEFMSIPVAMVYTVVQAPVFYVYEQGYGLVTHPVDHVFDTLAQLPVVEIPVDLLGAALGREVPWGQRGKGFFSLGALSESAGRLAAAPLDSNPPPVYSPEELFEIVRAGEGCGLPRCAGVFMIDASDLIRVGSFGVGLDGALADYTLGWVDPLGAHGDYRRPQVVWMIGAITNNAYWTELLRKVPQDPEERRQRQRTSD